ncbi:TPA: hypothetical protein ACH3X1_004866 [Trebouxia sp. C0004]
MPQRGYKDALQEEELEVLRAASQETDVISTHKVCEPQVPNLYPSSWGRGLQMVMQPITEDAKQGGTEWAALPEHNGWTLFVHAPRVMACDWGRGKTSQSHI